jgi:VWFA-related protein
MVDATRCFALFAIATIVCQSSPASIVARQPVQAPRDDAREPGAAPAAEPLPVTIRINAVVTDRRGLPILNLTAADFELRDNGHEQKLASVVLQSAPKPDTSQASPILSEEDERQAAREPNTRLFAVFLDEFHVAPGAESDRVRDVITQFVDREMRPRDLLVVMKPLDPVTAIRFTRDRDAARRVVQTFSGRSGDYTPRTSFEEQYFGRAPRAVDMARRQIVTNALRELTMRLGELKATRAAIVLVSRGFPREPGAERQRRLPDWQTLARAAGHFNVPIYALDPRDAAATAPPASGSPTEADRGLTMLQTLAAETGGEAVVEPNALLPALTRMARNLDAYYVLSYQPSQATDGTFHAIDVRTKRPQATVRVPSGYWSPLSAEWRAWLDRISSPPPPAPTRALRRSPLIETWIGFVRNEDGRMRLMFTWEPNAVVPQAPRRAPSKVTIQATTKEGTTLFEQELDAVHVPGEGERMKDLAAFDVPGGRVQLDLVIRAADGTVLDKGAQDIDVPAPRGTVPIILPIQIVRARTARDFRVITANPDSAPSPSTEFSRTERLLIRVPAFDPRGAAPTVVTTLVNRRGEKMREVARLSSSDARGIPQFDLPLGWLAPGEYGLDISVTGASGTSRQLIRFRLTG